MRPSRLILLVPALLLILAPILALTAPAASAASAAPAGCVPATPGALAAFFDANLPGRLAADHVPGAAVSVVAGGRTVLAKGYGLADAERRAPFDPDRSLVRIASITKLFTWTAVMQQVEAGRLDLDADVNTYLRSFKVPATYRQPVTLLELMNHTAGFEDRFVGTGAASAGAVRPLGDYLAANMPARIRRPGALSAYSNYGAGLAGYIVQEVSGEPYQEYVRRHILAPLGMAHSTAVEPPPGLARSYDSDARPPRPVPFTFDRMAPDGSVSASAADMARFMLAHLDGGRGILRPATAALMRQPSFKADPRLGGWAHGFMDRTLSGHRVLLHDGSWEGFESVLVLVPDCGLGVFITTNGTGGVDAVTDLLPRFLARFTPAQGGASSPTPGIVTGAPRPGFYEPARHNESTVEKLTTLTAPARLSVNPDGTLHFRGGTWRPLGGGLYSRSDRDDHLVALTGAGGLSYVATDGPTLQRMRPAETLPVNLAVLLVFALGAAGVPILVVAAAWRRLRGSGPRTSRAWRAARALAALATVLGASFLAALAEILFSGSTNFLSGYPLSFKLLLALPAAALLAGAAALVCTVTGWRAAGARWPGRAHQLTLLAGLGALTWFLLQWHLLGWQLS